MKSARLCASILVIAALFAVPTAARRQGAASDVELKAAFLYNFAKFTEWPALPPAAPISICITGDERMAAALTQIVRGQDIGGHALAVVRPPDNTTWQSCQMLFVGANAQLSAGALAAVKTLPVLTVSDLKGFSQAGGVIELYAEGGRMRFAINLDAAKCSGLRLSSRLLALAKLVRNADVQ